MDHFQRSIIFILVYSTAFSTLCSGSQFPDKPPGDIIDEIEAKIEYQDLISRFGFSSAIKSKVKSIFGHDLQLLYNNFPATHPLRIELRKVQTFIRNFLSGASDIVDQSNNLRDVTSQYHKQVIATFKSRFANIDPGLVKTFLDQINVSSFVSGLTDGTPDYNIVAILCAEIEMDNLRVSNRYYLDQVRGSRFRNGLHDFYHPLLFDPTQSGSLVTVINNNILTDKQTSGEMAYSSIEYLDKIREVFHEIEQKVYSSDQHLQSEVYAKVSYLEAEFQNHYPGISVGPEFNDIKTLVSNFPDKIKVLDALNLLGGSYMKSFVLSPCRTATLERFFSLKNVQQVELADLQILWLSFANDLQTYTLDVAVLKGFIDGKKNSLMKFQGQLLTDTHLKIQQAVPSGAVLKESFTQSIVELSLDFDMTGHCLPLSETWVAERLLNFHGDDFIKTFGHQVKNAYGQLYPNDLAALDRFGDFLNKLYQYPFSQTKIPLANFINFLQSELQHLTTGVRGYVVLTSNHAMGLSYNADLKVLQYFDPNFGIYELSSPEGLTKFFSHIFSTTLYQFDGDSISYVPMNHQDADFIIKQEGGQWLNNRLNVDPNIIAAILNENGALEIGNTEIVRAQLAASDIHSELSKAVFHGVDKADEESIPLLHSAVVSADAKSVEIEMYNPATRTKKAIRVDSDKLARGLNFLLERTSEPHISNGPWSTPMNKYSAVILAHPKAFSHVFSGLNVLGAVWQAVSFHHQKEFFKNTSDPLLRGFYYFTIDRLAYTVGDVTIDVTSAVLSLNQFATRTSLVAASRVVSRLGFASNALGAVFGVVEVGFDSALLHHAIVTGDQSFVATSAVSLTGGLVTTGLSIAALTAAALGSAVVSTTLGLVALPVAALFIGFEVAAGDWVAKRGKSEAAYDYLGRIMLAHETPYTHDAGSDTLIPSDLTPVSAISFRTNTVTTCCVHIMGNSWSAGNRPWKSDEYVELISGVEIPHRTHLTNPNAERVVLPLTGLVFLDWDTHYTSTAFSGYNSWQLHKLSKLWRKGFTFYNGFFTVYNVMPRIDSTTITILLDAKNRTFIMAEEKAYARVVNKDARQTYNLTYRFIGTSQTTQIILNPRDNGLNSVELNTDATFGKSTWVLITKSDMNSIEFMSGKSGSCKFKVGHNHIDVGQYERHDVLLLTKEKIMFAVDLKNKLLLPLQVSKAWCENSIDALEANLGKLPNVAHVQNVKLDDEFTGKHLPASEKCTANYMPRSGKIFCSTPDGLVYQLTSGEKTLSKNLVLLDLNYLEQRDYKNLSAFSKYVQGKTSLKEMPLLNSANNMKGVFILDEETIILRSDTNVTISVSQKGSHVVGVPLGMLEKFSNGSVASELISFSLTNIEIPEVISVERESESNPKFMWYLVNQKKIAFTCLELEQPQIIFTLFDTFPLAFEQSTGKVYNISTVSLTPGDVQQDSLCLLDTTARVFESVGRVHHAHTIGMDLFLENEQGLVFKVSPDLTPTLVAVRESGVPTNASFLRAHRNDSASLIEILNEDERPRVVGVLHTESVTVFRFSESVPEEDVQFVGFRRSLGDGRSFLYAHSRSQKLVFVVAETGQRASVMRCDFARRLGDSLVLARAERFDMAAVGELSALYGVASVTFLNDTLVDDFRFDADQFHAKKFVLATTGGPDVLFEALNATCNKTGETAEGKTCLTPQGVTLVVRKM